MKQGYHIAIVGATGAVGVELLRVLERRQFPVKQVTLLASAKSVGKKLSFQGQEIEVKELKDDAFTGVDFAFFSAGATRSRQFASVAIQAGAIVIDNSSAFRMQSDVPLVVPEVNPEDLKKHRGLIANPNCSAAILVVALAPLHRAAKLKRIIVSTYQSASGAGAKAMAELQTQTRDVLEGKPAKKEAFPHQIAFNVFNHNTAVAGNGYNEEENKIVEETQKMLHAPQLPIVPTCVRVPVLRAHSESILIETEKKLTVDEARKLLSQAPGVKVVDDRQGNHFPMPIEASGDLEVHVGRIREDLFSTNSLALFVSGDQLLKGAAWNAVQIAECLIAKK
ncbi:MAG: aspartate-semialdehyde dehydrogenase [Verrucomicrobiae bacterium]|nr:aspartate-semialdehyde dehydrogenase [Verrucomicrobiae bacterium]